MSVRLFPKIICLYVISSSIIFDFSLLMFNCSSFAKLIKYIRGIGNVKIPDRIKKQYLNPYLAYNSCPINGPKVKPIPYDASSTPKMRSRIS